MSIFCIVFYIVLVSDLFLGFFLLFPFISVVLASFFRVKKIADIEQPEKDFGIVITAYKDYLCTIPLVDSLLKQHYNNYHIYLVADSCEKDFGSAQLPYSDKLTILFPEKPLNSKVKSELHAIDAFVRTHEYTIIFDPDNLAHPDFLRIINNFHNAGYEMVQGKRTAKNKDSLFSAIDAAGEIFYNYTQRYVPFVLGSSAPLAGSGMSIKTDVLVDLLGKSIFEEKPGQVIVAEDKMLQLEIVRGGFTIAYADGAICFDEKINTASQTQRQRTRWLNSYFLHLKQASGLFFQGIRNINFNQAYFGLMISQPPIIILFLATVFSLILNLVISQTLFKAMFLTAFIFAANFFFVLRISNAPKEIWRSIFSIPLFMWQQVKALFRLKESNKDFMVTEKTKQMTIDEVLRDSRDDKKD